MSKPRVFFVVYQNMVVSPCFFQWVEAVEFWQDFREKDTSNNGLHHAEIQSTEDYKI